MAIEMGFAGGVTLPATVSGFNDDNMFEWTADVSRDVHPASDWNDALNGVVHLGGAYDLKGSCKCYFHGLSPDIALFLTAAVPLAGFYLTRNTTGPLNYKFTGLVSSFGETFNLGTLIVQVINFESSGEVEEDTA